MSEQDAINLLIEKGYMVVLKGKYNLTGEFHRTYIPVSTGLVVSSKSELATTSSPVMNITALFMEFIKQCEVPSKTDNGRGGFYWINRFNKDGAKEFARIISKEDVNLQVLIACTKLYYMQTKTCAKTISNYITEGIWRSGYQDMLTSLENGTIKEDIKKELQEGKQSNMKLR
jgi:hypothetical protein